MKIADYEVVKCLTSGAQGKCIVCIDPISKDFVVIKSSEFESPADLDETLKEVHTTLPLNHPNVAKVLKVFVNQEDPHNNNTICQVIK